MRERLMLGVAVAAILAVSAVADATVLITYSGAEVDTAADWRTASVAKSYDADHNNVYGSDGYILFNGTVTLPSYVSSSTTFVTGRSTDSDVFPLCDDPTTTPGSTPTKTYLTSTSIGSASNVKQVGFTVNANVPASFSISVMGDSVGADAHGGAGYACSAYQVGGPDGSANAPATANNDKIPDLYVFTITGAQAGDSIELWSSPGTLWNQHCLSAVGFDTAPEPSVLVLLITGVIGLLAYAWRKRK
jgi:hypothetical protein